MLSELSYLYFTCSGYKAGVVLQFYFFIWLDCLLFSYYFINRNIGFDCNVWFQKLMIPFPQSMDIFWNYTIRILYIVISVWSILKLENPSSSKSSIKVSLFKLYFYSHTGRCGVLCANNSWICWGCDKTWETWWNIIINGWTDGIKLW